MRILLLPIIALWLIFTGNPILPLRVNRPNGRGVIFESGWVRIFGVMLLIVSLLNIFETPLGIQLVGVALLFLFLVISILIALFPINKKKR
ncbi:MAG: hypothetical protein NTW14_11305 [bacterium]|nr:hypothetical protein [bacterium]